MSPSKTPKPEAEQRLASDDVRPLSRYAEAARRHELLESVRIIDPALSEGVPDHLEALRIALRDDPSYSHADAVMNKHMLLHHLLLLTAQAYEPDAPLQGAALHGDLYLLNAGTEFPPSRMNRLHPIATGNPVKARAEAVQTRKRVLDGLDQMEASTKAASQAVANLLARLT